MAKDSILGNKFILICYRNRLDEIAEELLERTFKKEELQQVLWLLESLNKVNENAIDIISCIAREIEGK